MSEVVKNATYLFEQQGRRHHSSESWWTSFFSMLVLYCSRQDMRWSLPTYVCRGGKPIESDTFSPGRLGFANLVVEAPLSENPFLLESWPNEFLQLKPDVCIIRPEERHAVFVEVKTLGASVARNHSRYLNIREHLRRSGWSAELYYLLSHGHECVGDWPLIEHDQVRVILWEDVLRAAAGTPSAEIFDQSLSAYATRPC